MAAKRKTRRAAPKAERSATRKTTKTSASLRDELELHREELQAQNEQLRAANAELSIAKERYAQLYDSAPVAYFTLDGEGMIVETNVGGADLLRASRQSLVGSCFDDVVAPSSRAAFRSFRRRIVAYGGRPVHDTTLRVKNLRFPVHIEAARLPGTAGPDEHCVLCVSDETNRRELEEERRRLEGCVAEALRIESLGMLAGGIAHDFNNILSVALAHTDLLLLDVKEPARTVSSLHEIRTATTRASNLAQQMLAYAGRNRVSSDPTDISELVLSMKILLSASAPKNVALAFDLEPDLPRVSGDEVQLQQVVLNLVLNAAEAISPKEGTITIRTRAESSDSDPSTPGGRHVVLEVADDGQGMDAATSKRAFDPFFSTKFAGRGLGLAVVHGNVRAHGGTVTIESEPNRGTRFLVRIPSLVGKGGSHARAIPAPPPESRWRGSGLVLVADDERSIRGAVGMLLERVGFEVCYAADGSEAIDVVHRSNRNLVSVILDLTMPRIGGAEALRQIKRLAPALPVILMTGYSLDALDDDVRSTADGFLPKPFTTASLLAAMQRTLELPFVRQRHDDGMHDERETS